eukprot:SAG11_NODE_75_length_18024_cov_5.885356_22_plen_290_part_00
MVQAAPSLSQVENARALAQKDLDKCEMRIAALEKELTSVAEAHSHAKACHAGELASFHIERSALLTDNSSSRERIQQLEAALQQQENLAIEKSKAVTSDVDQATATLRSQLASLQAELQAERATFLAREEELGTERERQLAAARRKDSATLEQRAEELHVVRAALEKAETKAKTFKAKSEAAVAKLQGELQDLAATNNTLEKQLKEQAVTLQGREQKAAQECERMFKLVQQAHDKVAAKEAEFQRQLAAEKQRFTTEFESELTKRMVGIQEKYEREAALRRLLFNQVSA